MHVCVYIIVDPVKHGVLTLIGGIQHYRNDRYYYHYCVPVQWMTLMRYHIPERSAPLFKDCLFCVEILMYNFSLTHSFLYVYK